MILGNILRDFLVQTLNNWKSYINHHRADSHSEGMEKILLFHAAFSNLYDASIQHKVQVVYDHFLSKLALNQDRKLLLFDYAPIIILQKIFSDFARDEDSWFHKILQLTSSRNSGARVFGAKMLVYYLNKNVDFKNEVLGMSLKEIFIKNAYTNIEEKYFDNIYLFSLIHLLQMPREEKQEVFNSLLDFAKECEALHDVPQLEKFAKQSEPIPNPFYSYFHDCQQTTLKALINLEFSGQQGRRGVQLDLFDQPLKPQFFYYFEDRRLQYYLMGDNE